MRRITWPRDGQPTASAFVLILVLLTHVPAQTAPVLSGPFSPHTVVPYPGPPSKIHPLGRRTDRPSGSPFSLQRPGDPTRPAIPLAGSCDGWHDGTPVNGVDGNVNAIAVDAAGSLYAGGDLRVAGGTPVNNIAKWDGATWSALGSGTNGWVTAIAVSGTDLYVVGKFTSAGGVPANNVAKWNGSTWSALGTGVEGYAADIAVSGTNVYVGGGWSDGADHGYVARWNGTTWTNLGNSFDSYVHNIAVAASEVYASGGFANAGGTPANRVAKWTGSSWSALSVAADDYVFSIGASGSDVYIGGQRLSVDPRVGYVAKWNGTGWSDLGSGMTVPGAPASVGAVAVSGTDVYAGGVFSTAGGVAAQGFAKWNGSGWSVVGSNGATGVSKIAVSGSDVFTATYAASPPGGSGQISRWNGTSWSSVGSAMTISLVESLTVADKLVYAGGYFTTDGGITFSRAAFWNGSGWTSIGSWPAELAYNHVDSIAVAGNNVYIGRTRSGNEMPTGLIDRWDGSSWSTLASNLSLGVNSNSVYAPVALAASGSDLYVGAGFTSIEGVAANSVAKWNGSSWSPLGAGANGYVSALAISGTDLYVGGAFSNAGGVAAQYIAKWNGANWSALGSGPLGSQLLSRPADFDVSVRDIDIAGTYIYASGGVNNDYGTGFGFVSRWNGSTWAELPIYLNDTVPAIGVSGSTVYAGGGFNTAGGNPANGIARWSGSAWNPLGSGTNGPVIAIALRDSEVFVGGPFTTAGCHVSAGFARYTPPAFPEVTLTGRVINAAGRGLGRIRVELSDSGQFQRYTQTNQFGYYRLPAVGTGRTYTVSISSKSPTLLPDTRYVYVYDGSETIDFTMKSR